MRKYSKYIFFALTIVFIILEAKLIKLAFKPVTGQYALFDNKFFFMPAVIGLAIIYIAISLFYRTYRLRPEKAGLMSLKYVILLVAIASILISLVYYYSL